MGNKTGKLCSKKENENIKERQAFVPYKRLNYNPPPSLTLPSQCDSASYVLSYKQSKQSVISETFSWGRMQILYSQQENLTAEHLSGAIFKASGQIYEMLRARLWDICMELQNRTLTVHEDLIAEFGHVLSMKNPSQTMTNTTEYLLKKIGIHIIQMIHLQHIVWAQLQRNKNAGIQVLIQVAVSHALNGVKPIEFRMMDWFIIHYVMKHKIASEDTINLFTIYVNTVTNFITREYEKHCVPKETTPVAAENKEHRNNMARVNYRIMRKWKKNVENYSEDRHVLEMVLEQSKPTQQDDDLHSVTTLTLKQTDCIMKHFVSRPPEEQTPTASSMHDPSISHG